MAGTRKSQPRLSWPRLVRWLLSGAVLVLFLPTWILHLRRTLDPYAFNDDARILIWPFFRITDPTLFPQDPFISYYQAGLPEGFLALYRLLGHLGLVRPASEWIQYLSVIAVAVILALTARRLGGNLASFLAVVFVLGSDSFFDRAGGGLPRAFAFPLMSAGLYALVTARPILLAALTLAGAAFYPVVAALLGACLLLSLVLPAQVHGVCARNVGASSSSRWSWRRRVVLLLVTFLGIVALSIPMLLRLRPYGAPITPAMLSAFPEAAFGGRLAPEHHPPFESILTLLLRHARAALLGAGEPVGFGIARWIRADELRVNCVVSLVVGFSALRVVRGLRTRPELGRLWILPLVACALHPIACVLAPRLFLPERYAQFAVPPFAVLLVAIGCGSRLLVPLARSSAGRCRDSMAALGDRSAGAGLGVKLRENEEGRGGVAAPRSGAKRRFDFWRAVLAARVTNLTISTNDSATPVPLAADSAVKGRDGAAALDGCTVDAEIAKKPRESEGFRDGAATSHSSATRRGASWRTLLRRFGQAYWHGATALAVLVLLAARGTSWVGIEVYVPPRERPLYAALANLPKNAVIAGWPAGPTENIPYLAQRRVLTNYQLEMPFHAGFTLESRARLDAFFEAYFATTLLPIERLCTEHHVTHLLVDRNHFVRSAPDYYEPHRSQVHRLHAAARGRFIVLDELVRDPSVPHFDDLSLVELSRVPALSPHCSARSAS